MRRSLNMIRNIDNWTDYLRFKWFGNRSDGFSFDVRELGGVLVPERLLHTFKECFFDESYFKGIEKVLEDNEIRTVVDVGANAGFFSMSALKRFPDAVVYACEPLPVNFEALKQYRLALDMESRWFPLNIALGDKSGNIQLHYDKSDSFSTSASINARAGEPDLIEVPQLSLRRMMEQEGIEQIDFLKLDCEGAEYGILYEFPPDELEKIRIIAAETHPGTARGHSLDALEIYLEMRGMKTRNDGKDLLWAWWA